MIFILLFFQPFPYIITNNGRGCYIIRDCPPNVTKTLDNLEMLKFLPCTIQDIESVFKELKGDSDWSATEDVWSG